TESANDSFSGGTIKDVKINGDFINSTIAAGVDPTDGILNNGNDTFLSPSKIGHTKVKGDTTNSFFLASSIDGKRGGDHDDHDDHGNHNGNHNGVGENEHNDTTRAIN